MRWPAAPRLSWDAWRPWFAWYPVRLETEWVWWEYVERQALGWAGHRHRALKEHEPAAQQSEVR